ncbi:MAG: class I SAM-dependent methyltransferase [Motilibacteraceae bacterium]
MSDWLDGRDDGLDADGAPAVLRRPAGTGETARANRSWWDEEALDYQAEHGAFLGDARFVWCPEGLDEAEAHLLGDVAGRRVLEVGAGAAQCSRWLAGQGAQPVAFDVSLAQLRQAAVLDARTGVRVPAVVADAVDLPFADASFDLACSAYGAVPFVADSARLMAEVARVLRPGGRWVFSVTHPVRWCFPDDPGEGGLTARDSYWDRTPYVEQDERGRATYVEHHRTLGDRVREVVAAGLLLEDVVEPEWPDWNGQTWGGWSPLRGAVLPGTAIFCCRKP